MTDAISPSDLRTLAAAAKAWPFELARELLKRIEKLEKAGRPRSQPVVFETGYGPSTHRYAGVQPRPE